VSLPEIKESPYIAPISTYIVHEVDTPIIATSTQPQAVQGLTEDITINPNCFCVTYARKFIPNLPRQDADKFKPNTYLSKGVLAIFKYQKLSHVAVVKDIYENGFTIYESNFSSCKEGERFIPFGDKSLVGFYKVV
jgi:hypothetical protein